VTNDRGFPRPPLPIAAPRADHFPTTALTTLMRDLRTVMLDGAQPRVSAAHAQLAETIMSRYAAPLEAYARGSTLREIAEPADLVHGYFASALADATYFTRYQASGMRMRRWLMNGLLLHARGVARDRGRAARREGTPLTAALGAQSVEPTAEALFDRAWALAILSEACAAVEGALLAEGRDRAWTVFRRHAIDGRSYIDLESELGLGRQQMADLVRGVTKRIRARMLELLESEGGDAAEELRDVLRLVS
jgi:hypothetical protein